MKIKVTLNVNEDIVKSVASNDDLHEVVSGELGWLHDSGMFVENWEEIKESDPEPSKPKTVVFGMTWEEYGHQIVDLPSDIDADDPEAVKNYLLSIWDDIPLPDDHDYVSGSDHLDEDFIEVR